KVEEYRSRYGGELPTQIATNLQAIQNAQVQLQSLADGADRASERRLLLERQVADLQAEIVPITPTQPAQASQDVVSTESTAQQLRIQRARLENMLTHLKPDHPDVRTMRRLIRDLEAKLEVEEGSRPATTPTDNLKELPLAERLRQQRIRDLKLQIDDIDRQLAEKQE